MKNKNILSTIAILFTLISALILGYLASKHFELKSGTTAGGSLCNISDTFNCDAVSASSYSEFLGIPIAVWGLMVQVSILALLLMQRFTHSQHSLVMAMWLSSINLIAVVVMGAISILLLDTYCLFCIASYLTLAIAFICIYKLQDKQSFKEALAYFLGEGKIYLGFLAFVPVASFIMTDVALGENYRSLQKNIQFYILQWTRAPEKEIPALTSVSFGAAEADAKMTIVEFADFNCIHCKHAAPVLHSFVKSHANTRLVFYHFPLDGACNPAIQRPGVSCDMAKASFCGHKLSDKGWSAQQAMFESPQPLNLEQSVGLVSESTGITKEDLLACMTDPTTQTAIEAQAKLGLELGVQGTPTVFVNNKLLQGGSLLPVLKEVYKSLR